MFPVTLIHKTSSANGLLPSPLWGGVGGGGRGIRQHFCQNSRPPSPALPHKGGGSRLSLQRALSTFHDERALAQPNAGYCPPQRPSLSSLHSSLTCGMVPRTLVPSLPSGLRYTSIARSSCTISRVAGSILTFPRGPSPDQLFSASTNFNPSSTLPLSSLIVWNTAFMASHAAADMKSG